MRADAYNARELAQGRILPKHVTALTELWQSQRGLRVDGLLGSQTRQSIEEELARGTFDPTPVDSDVLGAEPPDQREVGFGEFTGPLERIPRTRKDIYAMFGNPGTGKSGFWSNGKKQADKAWRKANIITVRDLPLVPHRWHFQVHRLAEPYVREGLRRASSKSSYVVERAACFNFRHIRHDPGNPLSLHSWGIAVDFDPKRNRARTLERGAAPLPWSDDWMKLWPNGVDEPFVLAMESVGFTWGGVWGRSGDSLAARSRRVRFLDPMHFELRIR